MKSSKTTNEICVLSEEKINQKMAGYKAGYSRKVNQAKGAERAKLEKNRESYLAQCFDSIMNENKKAVRHLAAVKAWATRRGEVAAPAKSEVKPQSVRKCSAGKKYSSSIKCNVVNKK